MIELMAIGIIAICEIYIFHISVITFKFKQFTFIKQAYSKVFFTKLEKKFEW